MDHTYGKTGVTSMSESIMSGDRLRRAATQAVVSASNCAAAIHD